MGKAHLRTNLPIFMHNAYGTSPNVPKEAGLRQLDVLESVGVNLSAFTSPRTPLLDANRGYRLASQLFQKRGGLRRRRHAPN